ncbi:50S ribosomal protein L4 [Candidatus Parcubacteria bacterium]|nr:MAG: 50S ribosomal protein L4 [Candidatus Parcubacteria bacterium]
MADINVKLYDFAGKEIGVEKLDPKLFGVEVKPKLVQDLVSSQQKNAREVLAHTKGRSEVRGGGKKPWNQKGTGRARHGSIRSPLWVGGGITFGPTSARNFSVKINKKLKKKVLTMVLSDKVASDRLILVDSYQLPEGKTKSLKNVLDKFPSKGKSTLIVTKNSEENIVRAAKNMTKVGTIGYNSLNILDILKNEYLFINKDLLNKVKEYYS